MSHVLRFNFLVLAMAIVLLLLCGCQEARNMRISWDNYDSRVQGRSDPAGAEYYIDDKYVGQGEAGFREILHQMRSLPIGSMVRFMDVDAGLGGSGNYREPYADYAHELLKIKEERKLDIN